MKEIKRKGIMSPLQTTVVGSMPKPDYLNIPCWVKDGKEVTDVLKDYNTAMAGQVKEDLQNQLTRATQEIINLQQKCGVTILTDGELRRAKYVYSFCRNLNGFDFENPRKKLCRNGAWEGNLPKIVSEISHKEEPGFMAKEWKFSQEMSERPIKITVPGPMTIMDTFYDEFYRNEEKLLKVLATCVNSELKKLAEAGCKEIQVFLFISESFVFFFQFLVRQPGTQVDPGHIDTGKPLRFDAEFKSWQNSCFSI